MPEGALYRQLLALGVVRADSVVPYAEDTRDMPGLSVWRDAASGVIFIADHYVGDEAYAQGAYRSQLGRPPAAQGQDYEDGEDTRRRLERYRGFYHGRAICDFGCGAGSFLAGARAEATDVCGIELQRDSAEHLRTAGIPCWQDAAELAAQGQRFDTVFAFHVLEHLPDPLHGLRVLCGLLRPGGRIVAEVPHARDLLLGTLDVEAFRRFTLWSQHLVLHTRGSLTRLLEAAGFGEVVVEGVQRYPLSNHLYWLRHGQPGGHRSTLAVLDTPDLRAEYAAALARLDATDTLVAVATVLDPLP